MIFMDVVISYNKKKKKEVKSTL